MVIVSGDSISMVSEAVSAQKNTIVFQPQVRQSYKADDNKHLRFIDQMDRENYILSTQAKDIGQAMYNLVKHKVKLKKYEDDARILEAVRHII